MFIFSRRRRNARAAKRLHKEPTTEVMSDGHVIAVGIASLAVKLTIWGVALSGGLYAARAAVKLLPSKVLE